MRIKSAHVRTGVRLKIAKHAGVVYNHGRWVARVKGKILGRYVTEIDAARAVAKVLGVGVKALKRSGIPKYLAKKLFMAAYRIFRKYVPADYDSMIAHETKAARMFRQDSLLCSRKYVNFICLLGVWAGRSELL